MPSTLPQHTRKLATLAAAAALVFATGCSTEPDDPGGSVGGGGCTGRTFIITYSAVGTGDGTFDFVSYDNGLGRRINVINPSKTWNIQIQMCEGDSVAMEGRGAVSGGNLVIAVTGDDGLGNQVTLSDEAVGDGTVTTYPLTIGPLTLP